MAAPHRDDGALKAYRAAVGEVYASVMARDFDVVVEQDEAGYYVASVPALPGCHTQAKSLDELMERVREAIALCLEVDDVPEQRSALGC